VLASFLRLFFRSEKIFIVPAKEDPLIDVSDEFRIAKLALSQLCNDHL
jgi:hypothetical protein